MILRKIKLYLFPALLIIQLFFCHLLTAQVCEYNAVPIDCPLSNNSATSYTIIDSGCTYNPFCPYLGAEEISVLWSPHIAQGGLHGYRINVQWNSTNKNCSTRLLDVFIGDKLIFTRNLDDRSGTAHFCISSACRVFISDLSLSIKESNCSLPIEAIPTTIWPTNCDCDAPNLPVICESFCPEAFKTNKLSLGDCWQAFPNPFKEELNIRQDDCAVEQEVYLINSEGKVLWNNETNSITTIQASHLPAGIYFLFSNDSHTKNVQKLIKIE